MLEHAAEHGANALVGVRYDANEVCPGVTEVLAYGHGGRRRTGQRPSDDNSSMRI